MSTLSELAETVSASAAKVLQLIKESNLPEPSFGESSVHDFDAIYNDKNIQAEALRSARNELINTAQDLAHVTMGPADYLCSMSWSAAKIANLGSLVRLEIPGRIPQGSTRKLSDLVTEIGLPELITTRVIRYAVANGLLYESPVGVIGHTAPSARLAVDRDMHNYCLMWSAEISSILVKLPDALQKQSVLGDRAPRAAANLAFPDYTDIFDYFEKRKDAAQRYSMYLGSRARVPFWSADALCSAWDWSSVGSGIVVDMGGSAGSTSIIIARAFPNLRVVNHDIAPEALNEGAAHIKKLGLDSRISFVQHDFFTEQKLSAEVYMFKSILHDWSDANCVKILRALVPALKDGSHVLVGECLMPAPPSLRTSAWDHEAKRVEDQAMIAGHGAHERTLKQFEEVFAEANESFRLNGVKEDVEGSVFSLIDFVFVNK